MMFLPFRRRLIFWLFRAYIRRWLKTILFFFFLGIATSVIAIKYLPGILNIVNSTQKIGVVGAYTIDTLPIDIQNKISFGLTKIEEDGEATPSAASSWEISPDGKIYTFKLRKDVYFQDGKRLISRDINYNFKDAKSAVLDESTIQFTLNDPFSPFLTVISQPIFKKGLVGLGEFKVRKIVFNGSFISTLTLINRQQSKLIYHFYPTEDAVKTAFTLGEIGTIRNLYNAAQFKNWPNVKINKSINRQELVVIFLNNQHPTLFQKNVRQGLVYALPDEFEEGESASSPLSSTSFAYQKQPEKFLQNLQKAKELLSGEATKSGILINLKTDEKLEDLAKIVANNWQEVGVKTNIETVKSPPTAGSGFQAFLGIVKIPFDPDQYVLWHSTQQTNITGYSNPKIDKLLEDGRKTLDKTEREKIYGDFQKYLIDDAPAAFLYYPTVYTVKRK